MKVCFLFALLFSLQVFAATYYVDYDAGNDTANGTATTTPWKHSPGDSNATDVALAAASTITGGDSVLFKGGVVYSGFVDLKRSGTPANPLLFQSASSWGTGRAILDGGSSMARGFIAEGTNCIISGLEIRNYTSAGVRAIGANGGNARSHNLVVTNCLIHDIDAIGSGWGIVVGDNSGVVLVSNTVYNVNNGIQTASSCTNVVIRGNTIYNCNTDGISGSCKGYWVIDGNTIYDLPENGNHNDAIQTLAWPGLLVIANNLVYNCGNSYFIELQNASTTNNTGLVNGQIYMVISNSTWGTVGPDIRFSYDGSTYNLGDKFTANATTNGTWLGDNGVLKTFSSGGVCYLFNNIHYATTNTTSVNPGLDNYSEVMTMAVFNNTFLKTSWGNSGRDRWTWLTNAYWFNNLMVNSQRGDLNFNGGTSASAFNWYTNSIGPNYNFGGNLTLAQFQAANPGHEGGSVESPVTFVNEGARNYRLSSGSGLGKGTNLTAFAPDLTSIPAIWRPDPTKDRDGVARGTIWDMGAYAYSTNTTTKRIGTLRVNNLKNL